jgi:pimeloyl-ACP methyl ester carboxylesterase
MIKAFGPSSWVKEMTLNWAGKNPKGLASLEADDSLNVYGGFFEQEHTIFSSNEDYKAGATVDIDAQTEDQKAGRKIKAPLFLLYSDSYIGSRYDIPKEWSEWVDQGVEIQSHGLGDGIGHFGAEEAPEESARVIGQWLKGLGLGGSGKL